MNTRARRERESRGRAAEAVAAWWLRLRGYRILGRRVRTPYGEIDIVARRGALLAIVEVKARRRLADALEAVTPRQQMRLCRAAAWLAARIPAATGCDLRFDVVVVRPARLPRHLADAWRPPPEGLK